LRLRYTTPTIVLDAEELCEAREKARHAQGYGLLDGHVDSDKNGRGVLNDGFAITVIVDKTRYESCLVGVGRNEQEIYVAEP
jgi:hypothetical protein